MLNQAMNKLHSQLLGLLNAALAYPGSIKTSMAEMLKSIIREFNFGA